MAEKITHPFDKPSPTSQKTEFSVPPPAAPIPGTKGTPPLPPGRTVQSKHYTEEELKMLQSVPGWSEGDPVPDNISEAIQKVVEEYTAEKIPVPDTQGLAGNPPPKQVRLSDLPPEKQQEIAKFVAEANQLEAANRAQESMAIPGAAPGVNEAIAGKDQIIIENDLTEDTPRGSSARAEPEVALLGKGTCPRCGWDISMPDIPDPDDETKEWYLQALLGQIPFRRESSLLGDRLKIVVRELSPTEVDAAYMAAGRAVQHVDNSTLQQFVDWTLRYRTCLQLAQVKKGDQVFEFCGSLQEWCQPGSQSPLSNADAVDAAYKYTFDTVLSSETISRVVIREVMSFNRLLAKLEVNAYNENFWNPSNSAG